MSWHAQANGERLNSKLTRDALAYWLCQNVVSATFADMELHHALMASTGAERSLVYAIVLMKYDHLPRQARDKHQKTWTDLK
eukprot:COSAG06_NODE_18879_length_864_cov_0.745098_1_plen_81_part_10